MAGTFGSGHFNQGLTIVSCHCFNSLNRKFNHLELPLSRSQVKNLVTWV